MPEVQADSCRFFFVNGLALSVSHLFDSSPKGRALGRTGNIFIMPKPPTLGKILPASGRNVTAGGKAGNRWHGVSRDGEGEAADRNKAVQA
jgi:hypothetical protein